MTSLKEMMREARKPHRNFMLENKSRVKKIEEQKKIEKESIVSKNVPRNPKYASVSSKVITTRGETFKQSLKKPKGDEQLSDWYAPSVKSLPRLNEAVQCNEASLLLETRSVRSQSTQTLDVEDGLQEGRVVTPSERAWKSGSVDSLHLVQSSRNLDEPEILKSQFTQRTASSAEEGRMTAVDADQMLWPNQQRPTTNRDLPAAGVIIGDHSRCHQAASDPMKAPSTYQKGVVPRYLRERQEEQQREHERMIREAPDPDCPPGHRKLTEEERVNGLARLESTRSDLITQLNRLPVRLDTLRAQNQRLHLDRELDKVDKLVLAFSKPKVFVASNEPSYS